MRRLLMLWLLAFPVHAEYIVKIPDDILLPGAIHYRSGLALVDDPSGFEIVDTNITTWPAVIPDDTYLEFQWHHEVINSYQSLDVASGLGVKVAVLDTGIDPDHEDLISLPGWNVYDQNGDSSDVYGHGTDVAGVIAATTNNALGVASIAPDAEIIPIRISYPHGPSTLALQLEAIELAVELGARVINLSYDGACTETMRIGADYAASHGAVVVFAAGNDGVDMSCGLDLDTMVVVSATGPDDLLMGWSSYGGHIDVTAPGSWIYTTLRYDRYTARSGTSFSAPIVSAVLALIFERNPGITPAEAIGILLSTARSNGDPIYYGAGVVDAYAATQATPEPPVKKPKGLAKGWGKKH